VNKSELVSRLTERLGHDRAVVAAAVDGVLGEIEAGVARGERVSVMGFGTFERRERAARTGRNPRTGATIQVAASAAPVFRPSARFRSLVTQIGAAAAANAAPAGPEHAVAKKNGKKSAKKAARMAAATSRTVTKAPKKPKKATGKDGRKAAKKAR
jgi:DNA-binding protein HU-beta